MNRRYRPFYATIIALWILMIIIMDNSFNIAMFIRLSFIEGTYKFLIPAGVYASEQAVIVRGTGDSEVTSSENAVFAPDLPDELPGNIENNNDIMVSGNVTNSNISENANIIENTDIIGNVYARSDLEDYNFLLSNFYTVTSITSLTNEMLRPKEFLDMDLSMKADNSSPQILIFHTHSQEGFVDTVEGDVSTTIVGVGDYLAQLLTEKYGYNVMHDTTVYDYIDGKLDRSNAYTYAENNVQKLLEQYPDIEVIIDLHRDGVADDVHLITEIDGKNVAKLMFFNGVSYSNVNGDIGYLYNPNRDENLAMSLQMHLLGQAYYPDLLRKNYINAYRYSLFMRGKSMLVEAGAQTNTVEEVKNAMEPLADILDKLLKGKKAY